MMKPYETLQLERQLCFPLYACAKEVVRQYRKPLAPLHLTYTQYIVMLVFWQYGAMTEKELGQRVRLDSGTLAPLLKRLEKQGLVKRERPESSGNTLLVSLTEAGDELRHQAVSVPEKMHNCVGVNAKEAEQLRSLLDKALAHMDQRKETEP